MTGVTTYRGRDGLRTMLAALNEGFHRIDGKLRRLYFRGDTRELFRLAEDRGVELTDERVPGE